MLFSFVTCYILTLIGTAYSQTPKQKQLQSFIQNTEGQTETTNNGAEDNTTNSLRAGPRGHVLLEDTNVRKKMIHFDRERQPERVVHAAGHGAYGTFESSDDWSNITSACWLQKSSTSDVFVRFSVVVAGIGGSEVGRDTHGFATKIYSECGNQDLVGNHLPSFFINDGALFPDLVHAVKAEPDKGFPTGGTAHTNAYDFFTKRPEGTYQLMNVLTDLGIPRDVRHIAGAGIHTYRFINNAGKSTLFKWYWQPHLGLRSLVYDEATKIAGKNPNFQRVDLFTSIAAGLFPKWDLMIQLFPDDGSYMFKGIDLLDPTKVIPNELAQPVKFGTMTLNKNPTNYFSETESIAFAPSNVVKGVTFVPDPLLQWRLMAYDDTHTHRLGSPNNYLLPVNRPILPVNNNFRDGFMQPEIYVGASASSPDGLGGVIDANAANTLDFGNETVSGAIGRYSVISDAFTQASSFWNSLDPFAQQHTVDAYRFELGNVANSTTVSTYIDEILNNVDNCLARRVAFGVGAPMPAFSKSNKVIPVYASEFKLANQGKLSVEGLVVGILADDSSLSIADLSSLQSAFSPLNLMLQVVAPHQGMLKTGVSASASYITTSSVFYDAIIIGGTEALTPASTLAGFIMEAFGHGKPIAAIGNGTAVLSALHVPVNASMGVFASDAASVAKQVIQALMTPGRFPQRNPLDSASICE